MAKVYVVQHAQKESLPGDPGLTALGHRQADRVARLLASLVEPGTPVVSSPLRRARQTAEPIALALRSDVAIDENLIERMNWDGSIPIEQFLAEWQRATEERQFTPTVGEPSAVAGSRFAAAVDGYLTGGSDAVLVSHGGVTIDGLRTMFGDAELDARHPGWPEGMPAGGLTVIGGTESGVQLLRVADVGHLTARDASD